MHTKFERDLMRGVGRHFEVVLISTYELGHQPFGLASPAAWLRALDATVTCIDLSLEHLNTERIRTAALVAFYLPMHTATRIAIKAIRIVRRINPTVHLCAYGLYAVPNAEYLRNEGIGTILGGEFEEALCKLAVQLSGVGTSSFPAPLQSSISLKRQKFLVPDRSGLPALKKYARLSLPNGEFRTVGYTEATRGCKHQCRHCPIVPVYNGTFRIVQQEVVLEDIRQQVDRGAQHITFGDPDFFNGVGHAIPLVESVHREFEHLTYDVTIKIEHLKKNTRWLPVLRDTGCLFITSAVEAVDDRVLDILGKGHTRVDFIEVATTCRSVGLNLAPTFVTFTPWLTLEGYRYLLSLLAELDLVPNVSPIQLAIRLLIPSGSRLLEREEVRQVLGEFDEAGLSYRWLHSDSRVDALQRQVENLVKKGTSSGLTRGEMFQEVWSVAQDISECPSESLPRVSRTTIPYLTEPWYC
jgi:radical SAM superfamily enzyme YgiQ (UPF0313 family)